MLTRIFVIAVTAESVSITIIITTGLWGSKCSNHYETMPIQIYRKFHLQKLKMFR